MIFRWSIWGLHKTKSLELLTYSILSFKHHFGDAQEYVVCTDDVVLLEHEVGNIAQIIDFNEDEKSIFDIESKATWKKWCPRVKLDIDATEIYIDSDIFLIKYPIEIEKLIADPRIKFAVMDEYLGQPWQHGAMQRKSTGETPFINAGIFIQKAGFSIAENLEHELDWWKQHILPADQTHHDEQGALAISLTPYCKEGKVCILPKEKYMMIGPNENKDVDNLENVTMFHAVYPDHPAFYKFKDHLDIMLGR